MKAASSKLTILIITSLICLFFCNATEASAQISVAVPNSVAVEGNCFDVGSQARTTVTPGTCGDYDGDGSIGTAEDLDGDNVFGTISAALSAGGINANGGSITIVTSGTFSSVVEIFGSNGNVTVQAAPGVEAIITNTVPPFVAGNAEPQATVKSAIRPLRSFTPGFTGIFIDTLSSDRTAPQYKNRYVTLRNLTVRNSAVGVFITGNSNVAIENCRFENNIDRGIDVTGNAKVSISKTEVHATNFGGSDITDVRVPSNIGTGIVFRGRSSGTIFLTTVSGSLSAGISNQTGRSDAVCAYLVSVFANGTNFVGVRPSSDPCGGDVKTPRNFFPR